MNLRNGFYGEVLRTYTCVEKYIHGVYYFTCSSMYNLVIVYNIRINVVIYVLHIYKSKHTKMIILPEKRIHNTHIF